MKITFLILCLVSITIPVFAGDTYESELGKQALITKKVTELLKKVKTQEELEKQQDELKKLDQKLGVSKKKVLEFNKKFMETSTKLKKISEIAIKDNMRVSKIGEFEGLPNDMDIERFDRSVVLLQEKMSNELQKMIDLLKKIKEPSDLKKYKDEWYKTDKKLNDLGFALMKEMETLRLNKTILNTRQQRLAKELKRLEEKPEMKTILSNYKNIKETSS